MVDFSTPSYVKIRVSSMLSLKTFWIVLMIIMAMFLIILAIMIILVFIATPMIMNLVITFIMVTLFVKLLPHLVKFNVQSAIFSIKHIYIIYIMIMTLQHFLHTATLKLATIKKSLPKVVINNGCYGVAYIFGFKIFFKQHLKIIA